MARILAQVTLAHDSGLPADACVNTFTFEGDAAVASATIPNALAAFYGSVAGAAPTYLSSYLSSRLSGDYTIKLYDMSQPVPRVPFTSASGTFPGGVATTTLPEEVALCLSFRGEVESGVDMATRRGRVYIGPLSQGALNSTTDPTPKAGLVTTLLAAADDLATTCAAAGVPWGIYSSKTLQVEPVVYAWVDNAFDTQRRRGPKATSRTGQAVG